jgi:hypothetical protein
MKEIYLSRQQALNERNGKNKIDIHKVRDLDIEKAEISKKDFEQIKLLISVDENVFIDTSFDPVSSYSYLVDLSKYDLNTLNKDAKELFYRPN